VDVNYEQALRRAMANRVLRSSPEAKAVYDSMPKQAKSWRAAMRKTLENPTVADRVSREINNALGDFTNLAPFEQNVLRQLAPFYAWYRAITLVMLKMPVDNAIRTSILVNLGKIGEANDAEGYPFGGAIPIGKAGAILKTAGINPYNTVPQIAGNLGVIGRAYVGAIPGTHIKAPEASDVGYAAGGLANPLIVAPFSGGIGNTITHLPEGQLLYPQKPKHPERALYRDYDRTAMLWQYLGVPIRHLRRP
jgi:hypothetical protein